MCNERVFSYNAGRGGINNHGCILVITTFKLVYKFKLFYFYSIVPQFSISHALTKYFWW